MGASIHMLVYFLKNNGESVLEKSQKAKAVRTVDNIIKLGF